jgi:hypothetical protein
MPSKFDPTGNAQRNASSDFARRYSHMLDIMMNPYAPKERKQGVELLLACEVLEDLENYGRRPSPKMPAELGEFTEQELIDKVRKTAKATRPGQADKDLVQLFALWRAGVFLVESVNAGRVEVLYSAARAFDAASKEYPAHAKDLLTLGIFFETEWSEPLLPILSMPDARRRAPALACDLVTLPSYLRTMADTDAIPKERKRGGAPTRIQGSWMQDFENKKK